MKLFNVIAAAAVVGTSFFQLLQLNRVFTLIYIKVSSQAETMATPRSHSALPHQTSHSMQIAT